MPLTAAMHKARVCRRLLPAPAILPMRRLLVCMTGAMERRSQQRARADPADGLVLIDIACDLPTGLVVMMVAARE